MERIASAIDIEIGRGHRLRIAPGRRREGGYQARHQRKDGGRVGIGGAADQHGAIKLPEHHQRIDQAKLRDDRMPAARGPRSQSPCAATTAPPVVAGDHEIELHRPKSRRLRGGQRMAAQSLAKPPPAGLARHHEARIGDMRARAGPIGAQITGAQNPAPLFGDEDGAVRREPMRERIRLRHVARQGIGLAGANDRLHDAPDRIAIVRLAAGSKCSWPRDLVIDLMESESATGRYSAAGLCR